MLTHAAAGGPQTAITSPTMSKGVIGSKHARMWGTGAHMEALGSPGSSNLQTRCGPKKGADGD